MNDLRTNDKRIDLEGALTECSWRSSQYTQQLQQDPAAALAGLGVSLPSGVRFDARVQRRDTLYFVIPPMTHGRGSTAEPEDSTPNQMDLWSSADQFCWILPERLKIELLKMRQSHRHALSGGKGLPYPTLPAAPPSSEKRELEREEGPAREPSHVPSRDVHDADRSPTVDPADHYRLLSSDSAAREQLINEPKAELDRYFGYMPAGDYRIEVIDQRHDTITALMPSPPPRKEMIDDALDEARGRIYDILFTTGVGGYLIPDDDLKWVLRDMRSAWIEGRKSTETGEQ